MPTQLQEPIQVQEPTEIQESVQVQEPAQIQEFFWYRSLFSAVACSGTCAYSDTVDY